MQAETNDGNPRRDFVEYDHPDGAYTLEAHVVTPQTEGQVTVPGGQAVDVRAGDVLVKRGNYYEVHNASAWREMGLEPQRDQRDLEPFSENDEPETEWDPNEHTAAEVRRYLRDPNTSDEEKDRVREAEQNGQNRASAFPR
jgi:hypothetical protein